MINQMRQEIKDKVQEAVKDGKDIDIAGVKIRILDQGDQFVAEGFGRDHKPTAVSQSDVVRSICSEILHQVKTRFREAGPEAALEAIRGS